VSFRVSDPTPKKGQRVRFFGTVAPTRAGKPVLIQKKTSTGTYKTVTRTTTSSKSTYSKRLKIRRRGTYRVVVQSLAQDLDDGTSRSRTLRVH
jgi:hypothetical protein